MEKIGQILETIDILGQTIHRIQNEWEHDAETDDALIHVLGMLTWLDITLSREDGRI